MDDDQTSNINVLIETMARLQGIALTDEMMPQVRFHFEVASRMAEALSYFPLDDREEPAPVYTP